MDHISLRRPQFFFTTAPMPCPYLPGRQERKVVTELSGVEAVMLHDSLSQAGFRRSHAIAYAPACNGCSQCVPVRIDAEGFHFRQSFRRILKRNADLKVRLVKAKATAEQFRLFSRYQESRHGGSDMAQMVYHDYRAMVEDSPINTHLVEMRNADSHLVATCLTDGLSDGFSAVYSFFDPELPQRSLGTYSVLWLVGEARRLNLPYVYLGYWVAESRKMSYKGRFGPIEAFTPNGWQLLSESQQQNT
ncbi:MAG: arginyltransferase [Alphaproteobacteria bacterium]